MCTHQQIQVCRVPPALPCVVAPVGALLPAPGHRNKTCLKWLLEPPNDGKKLHFRSLQLIWLTLARRMGFCCLLTWGQITSCLHGRITHTKIVLIKKTGSRLANFKSNYLQICLFGNKAQLISNQTFQQKCVLVFALKEFPVWKTGCIVTGSKQGKCLQIAHMQFWFGQDIFIPPTKQLQNPFFFHCSLLKAVESSQQSPAW